MGISVSKFLNTSTHFSLGATDYIHMWTGGTGNVICPSGGVDAFLQLFGANLITNSAEADSQTYSLISSVIIDQFFVLSQGNAGATNATLTLRVNGADRGTPLTIPALSGAGYIGQNIGSITINSGDLLDIRCNNGGSASSVRLNELLVRARVPLS